MKATLIDLNDYRQSGEGANGASYDSLKDPDEMVKMYFESYPLKPIFDELEVARLVYELGVPSPKPGELVTDGKRYGIKFRRISGKRSFSRMFADEPERTEEFARELSRLCKKLHAIRITDDSFPDTKEQSRYMLAQIKCLTEDQKAFLSGLIDAIPDSDCANHGDMHFGNIITTLPKGSPLSAPHETYFIDLGYFAKGHPMLDLAMMSNICEFSTEEFVFHDMHIHKPQAQQVYDCFLDEYFFSDDRIADKWFGPGQNIASIREKLKACYCVKSIMITYNLGFLLPEFKEELDRQMNLR